MLVFIVGIIDSYYKIIRYNILGLMCINMLLHLIGLYPLIDFKKYLEEFDHEEKNKNLDQRMWDDKNIGCVAIYDGPYFTFAYFYFCNFIT